MQIGYIAEEVSQIHHLFATYGNDEKPMAIDYNVITVFLVEEVKKLKNNEELLKKQIELQQRQIETLMTGK
jgi:hypothetical protein